MDSLGILRNSLSHPYGKRSSGSHAHRQGARSKNSPLGPSGGLPLLLPACPALLRNETGSAIGGQGGNHHGTSGKRQKGPSRSSGNRGKNGNSHNPVRAHPPFPNPGTSGRSPGIRQAGRLRGYNHGLSRRGACGKRRSRGEALPRRGSPGAEVCRNSTPRGK